MWSLSALTMSNSEIIAQIHAKAARSLAKKAAFVEKSKLVMESRQENGTFLEHAQHVRVKKAGQGTSRAVNSANSLGQLEYIRNALCTGLDNNVKSVHARVARENELQARENELK